MNNDPSWFNFVSNAVDLIVGGPIRWIAGAGGTMFAGLRFWISRRDENYRRVVEECKARREENETLRTRIALLETSRDAEIERAHQRTDIAEARHDEVREAINKVKEANLRPLYENTVLLDRHARAVFVLREFCSGNGDCADPRLASIRDVIEMLDKVIQVPGG